MNERFDIQYGKAFIQNLQDDNGYVDLTGAIVVFQYRVDCGTIHEVLATILDATTGQVAVYGIPVGSYQIRWKVTPPNDPEPPSPGINCDAVIYGHGSPEGVVTGMFQGQFYVDLDTLGLYIFGGTPTTMIGWG